MRLPEVLVVADMLRIEYVQPWVEDYLKTTFTCSKTDNAKSYFAFAFLNAYDDAACDAHVQESVTNAIVWLGGFHQFQRHGIRRARARHFRDLRQEVAASYAESIARLEKLTPIIQQIFVDGADPLIAKLSS